MQIDDITKRRHITPAKPQRLLGASHLDRASGLATRYVQAQEASGQPVAGKKGFELRSRPFHGPFVKLRLRPKCWPL